jgi:hypothetical protein
LLLPSDASMESGTDSDDFVENNTKRAQRRFKVLQRQHTPGHAAATASQKKRKTPASAPKSSKRSAATPVTSISTAPKAPAKTLEHSLALSSCGSRKAADAKEQQQASQQQQQQQQQQQPGLEHPTSITAARQPLTMPPCSMAAGDAQDGLRAARVAACLPSTCQQQQQQAQDTTLTGLSIQPDGFDTRTSDLAQQSCRYSNAEEPVEIDSAAAEAGASLAAATPHQLQASAAAACPVCGASLADISSTEAGQAAHVNACLDAATATDAADSPGDAAAGPAEAEAVAAIQQGGVQERQQQQQLEVIDVDAEEDITAW